MRNQTRSRAFGRAETHSALCVTVSGRSRSVVMVRPWFLLGLCAVLAIALLPFGPTAGAEPVFYSEPAWQSGSADYTVGVAVGDVDCDGDLDLLCGNGAGLDMLYLNEGGRLSTSPSWTSDSMAWTRSVALGDVNGDGYPDLVRADSYDGVMLHLNTGMGFSISPDWQDGLPDTLRCSWQSVVMGDVDSDGDLDLVCGGPGNVSVFANTHGVFSTAPICSFTTKDYTLSVALGDIDGDTDLDLVCGNSLGAYLMGQSNTLYLNQGGWYASSPAWSSGPANCTQGVALGDIDGDGDLDLVCCNAAGDYGETPGSSLYMNDNGVFSDYPIWYTGPTTPVCAVALGDVDGDGDLDLVCGNGDYYLPAQNTLYLNEDGVFPTSPSCSTSLANPTMTIALADIDGDGDLDLICGNAGQRNALYMNDRPLFSYAPSWTGWYGIAQSVTLGDVNGDGLLDLASGNDGPSTVYLNNGGSFSSRPDWQSLSAGSARRAILEDMDLDGYLDLICGNSVYHNIDGVLTTRPWWTPDEPEYTFDVAVGDVNADDYPDLVCGNFGQSNTLYLNDEGALETVPAWSSAGESMTVSIALGDIDWDGYPELACANSGYPSVNSLYLNRAGVLSFHPDWTWGATELTWTHAVILGDVDGDGLPDLICGNENGLTVRFNQQGSFSRTPDFSIHQEPDPGGRLLAHGNPVLEDADGDGDLDLLGVMPGPDYENAAAAIYINDGGTFRTPAIRLSDPTKRTTALTLGDVDRDGDVDLVCGNHFTPSSLHPGLRNPSFLWDPQAPINQLPNNCAFLDSVDYRLTRGNVCSLSVRLVDIESDPVYIVAEYQFRGAPVWYPAEVDGRLGRVGPLSSSPEGVEHGLVWDMMFLPFDKRSVVIRLRAVSTPVRVGLVQRVTSYHIDLGKIDVRRPVLSLSTDVLLFPTVTLGDTVSKDMVISNAGNESLIVEGIGLPSPEMGIDWQLPLTIEPADSETVGVFLYPRSEAEIYGEISLQSNDPLKPVIDISIETDIRDLVIETRLLEPAPTVPLGQAFTVIVSPAPQVHIERGYVFYRSSAVDAFSDSVDLVGWGDDFIGVIPGPAITEAGIDYFVRVENSGIYATDPPGAPRDSLFFQAVTKPEAISAAPQPNSGTEFIEGREIKVLVSLPVGADFIDGGVHCRRGGERGYLIMPVEPGLPLPGAIIPDSLVGPCGIEYWVEVQTLTTILTSPPIQPEEHPYQIRVSVSNLVEERTWTAKKYRIASIPLDFGDDFSGTIEALLSDQSAFGPYDPVKWKAFRYAHTLGDYVELSGSEAEAFKPVPGFAFWLISSSSYRIDTAPLRGWSTPTDRAYELALDPGWNMIGNPFAFPVAWDSVSVDTMTMAEATGTVVDPLWRWEPVGDYKQGINSILPFEGYWLMNLTGSEVTLKVPPIEAHTPSVREAPVIKARSVLHQDRGSWRLGITASSCDAVDSENSFGLAKGAAAGWDCHDRFEPPLAPGHSVSLYFPHLSWQDHPGNFACDIRGDFETSEYLGDAPLHTDGPSWGQTWYFDIAKNFAVRGVGDEVLLTFRGVERVPKEACAYLIDREFGKLIDLRACASYRFHLGTRPVVSEANTRFIVLVGSEGYVGSRGPEVLRPPTSTLLHQSHPNPFTSSTLIRFDLAEDSRIGLTIFDATGAVVRVLCRDYLPPGRYEIAWYGDNENGNRVSPGLYFCRLVSKSGYARTVKILLLG